MNKVAEACIDLARQEEVLTKAHTLWAAAQTINRLEHEIAEAIVEISDLKERIKNDSRKKG
jgi:hypothetical protein